MLVNAIPFPDLSPVLVEIPLGFTTLPIRWYALAYIAGILIGWRIVVAAIRRPGLWPGGRAPMTAEQVELATASGAWQAAMTNGDAGGDIYYGNPPLAGLSGAPAKLRIRHEALDGGGKTVAILGTGIDRVYPARNRELAHAIAANGALVSEYPLGAAPERWRFPERNRLISGLSLGTLVVEAALRSGSLITARSALEQGREVFAIPGSIHNPLARGCHALIRDGAKLVETSDHILEELASQITGLLAPDGYRAAVAMPSGQPQQAGELSAEYRQLLEFIEHDAVSVDQLVERSGLTPEEVSSMLLVLELDGHLVSGAGGRYSRARLGA